MKFFTVGPTEISSSVKRYIGDALATNILSASHRGAEFVEVSKKVHHGMRDLFQIPSSSNIFFVGSATEAMERTIQNTVDRSSFHFVNGTFSKKFLDISKMLGRDAQSVEVPLGVGFDFENVDICDDVELICFTHNETSTGVMSDINEIYKCIDRYGDKLTVIDVVSSFPIVDIDFSRFDVVFFSVQKCLGLPSGLGVMLVSERAYKKAEKLSKLKSIGSYHNFIKLKQYADKYQTFETPNILGIYLLGRILEDLGKEGMDALRERITKRAEDFYNRVLENGKFSTFARESDLRSTTSIVLNVEGALEDLHKYVESFDMKISQGYGELKNSQVRIANFPAMDDERFYELIDILCDYK